MLTFEKVNRATAAVGDAAAAGAKARAPAADATTTAAW